MYANAGGFPVSFMWRFIKCFVMHRNNSGELLDRGSNWLRSCIQITGSTIKGCTAAFVMVQLETAKLKVRIHTMDKVCILLLGLQRMLTISGNFMLSLPYCILQSSTNLG